MIDAIAEPLPVLPFLHDASRLMSVALLPQTRVLNREVRVVLEGVDKHGNLLGSLMYPEAETPVDLGEKLVSSGLAKVFCPHSLSSAAYIAMPATGCCTMPAADSA